MIDPDFPASHPPVWPHGVLLNDDGTTGPRRASLDPRRQFYWVAGSPLASSFQAAHVLAFGSRLLPQHYSDEMDEALRSPDALPGVADKIRSAIRAQDGWEAIRLYLDRRRLLPDLERATERLRDMAASGQVKATGRPTILGSMTGSPMAGPRRSMTGMEFMDTPIQPFGNYLGEPPSWLVRDLLFNLDERPFVQARDLHFIRFQPAADTAGLIGEQSVQATVNAERIAQRHLEDLFRLHAERTMTKPQLIEWLAEKMGRALPERAFDRAKAAAVVAVGATAWKSGGRPSSKTAH